MLLAAVGFATSVFFLFYYSMSKSILVALLSRGLPYFKAYTLGQMCHIVQLAISERKVLGYHNGDVVAYSHSSSMMKDRFARRGQACEIGASS